MKYRKLLIVFIIGLLATVTVISCSGGSSGDASSGDLVAPNIFQTSPVVNGNNIPITTTVSVIFSEIIDPSTLSAETFTVTSAFSAVSGTVVCTGSTATFLPDTPLEYDTYYTVKLTTGVADLAGNSLTSEYSWSFTTVVVGPGDPDNYMPFTQGSTWVFEGVITEIGMAPKNYTNTLSINGTYDVDGKTTTVFIESNPGNLGSMMEAYLYKDLNGITYYGNSDLSDNLIPQIIPYQEINFPVLADYNYVQVHKADLDFGMDLDLDGINETADLLSMVTVVGFDTVTVPAGTFVNCIEIETEVLITLKMSRDNSVKTFRSLDTNWYAPHVGPVKRNTIFTEPDGNTETIEEQLTGHFTILTTDLAAADSNTESPGKPAVAYDGINYLVVTRRVVSQFDSSMIGLLVSEAGEVLNTFDVSTADTGGYLSSNRADVTFGANNYLVVFGQNGQIAGQRVTSAGQALDGPSGFAITSTGTNTQPVVAFDGTNFLVVWQKYIDGGYDIYGARISEDGQVLGEFLVFAASGEQISPAIAFDGNNSLVVWRDTRSGSGPSDDTDIYATRVTPGGLILDPLGVAVCSAPGFQGSPALAFDGSNYFSVWEDGRIYAGATGQILGFDIYGTRITTDGVVLDMNGIPINTVQYMDFNGKLNPTVTFDGNNYFVTWQTGSYSNHPPAGIFATWVSTIGQVINNNMGEDGLSISGPPSLSAKYIYPVVESGTNNILVTWINLAELSGTSKDIRATLIRVP